jgi:hypothetical protein
VTPEYQIKSNIAPRSLTPPITSGNFFCNIKFNIIEIGNIEADIYTFVFTPSIYYFDYRKNYLSRFAVINIISRMFIKRGIPSSFVW